MKKILCLLILSLLFLTACTKEEEKSTLDKIIKNDAIVIGIKTDSPPFGFINETTGQEDGFDVDIAKYVAREILGSEDKLQFVSVTPNSRIEAITSGEVDMVIATLSITPQRQYLIDFSKPYFIAGQTALVHNDSNIHTFADLKNKTTIVTLGSNSEKHIRSITPTAKIIGYKNYDDAFQALKDGVGDALSSDDAILIGIMMKHKDKDYRLLKNRISRELYAIGIKKEEDKKLKDTLDIIITRMNNDGTMKELKHKWNLN